MLPNFAKGFTEKTNGGPIIAKKTKSGPMANKMKKSGPVAKASQIRWDSHSMWGRVITGFILIITTFVVAWYVKELMLSSDKIIIDSTLQRIESNKNIKKEDEDEGELGILKQKRKSILTRLVAIIVFWVIVFIGLHITMQIVGFKTTGILALLTAVCFTVGLAVQGVLGDFVSGILIATFAIYSIGDAIEVEGTLGVVVDFRLLHTVLRDFHTYSYITVPNNKIYNNVTTNFSLANKKWIRVKVKLSNISKQDVKLPDLNFIRGVIIDDILKPEQRDKYPDVDFTRIKPELLKLHKENGAGGVQVVVFDMTEYGTDIRVVYPVKQSSTFYAQMRLNTRVRQILYENKIDLAWQG
jgi:small-conductance mechanosensitive channel